VEHKVALTLHELTQRGEVFGAMNQGIDTAHDQLLAPILASIVVAAS
jgi:hypothetical protein